MLKIEVFVWLTVNCKKLSSFERLVFFSRKREGSFIFCKNKHIVLELDSILYEGKIDGTNYT